MKHGNNKETFATGAQRDSQIDKPLPGLLSPFAAERKAIIMAKGAAHYGPRNWEKGMNFSRVLESAERHIMAFKQGKTDEDHLGQAAWNLDALLHFDEGVKRGFLPATLNDMPKYEPQPVGETVKQEVCTHGPKYKVERPESPLDSEITLEELELAMESFEAMRLTTAIEDRKDRLFQVLLDLGASVEVAYLITEGTTFPAKEVCNNACVYIAGPMRGYKDFNFPAFDAARDTFLKLGYAVISPADIDRVEKADAPKATAEEVSDQARYIERDSMALRLLSKQNYSGNNGVVLLTGWESSKGAAGEFFTARWHGLKFYHHMGSESSADNYLHDFALRNVRTSTK
jgi:hypothetical protein